MVHVIALLGEILRCISPLEVPMHLSLPDVEFSILLSNGFSYMLQLLISNGTQGNDDNIVLETGCCNSEPII